MWATTRPLPLFVWKCLYLDFKKCKDLYNRFDHQTCSIFLKEKAATKKNKERKINYKPNFVEFEMLPEAKQPFSICSSKEIRSELPFGSPADCTNVPDSSSNPSCNESSAKFSSSLISLVADSSWSNPRCNASSANFWFSLISLAASTISLPLISALH